jgi:cysteinyl-tRNA synthetase
VTLKLYNTRTRRKEEFRPLDPSNVRMYVCGPTVYDYAHIGNARPVIVFDVLFRLLRHIYGPEHVTYVRNITDVDDKINARAVELYPDVPPEQAIRKLTEETAAQFHQDVAALGCLPPTHEPRATEYIPEMKEMITRLHEAGVAYVAEEHVLFSVAAYGELKDVPRYGSLARRSLDEMIAGARVEVAPYKRDPMDFVLWKPSKAGEPGWPSPLNIRTPGRPGWHLECSAMSKALLGDEFDIHGGGIDLMFPHHENEVAQSCGANQTRKMANVWMHNGFLQVEGQKMSKSLGNFVTIRELLVGWHQMPWAGAAIRLAMLQTHYRQPIDWTFDNTLAARRELSGYFTFIFNTDRELREQGSSAVEYAKANFAPSEEILDVLSDDLNTPAALAILRKRYQPKDNPTLHFQNLRDLMFLGVVNERTAYIFSFSASGDGPAEEFKKAFDLLYDYRIAMANGDHDLAVARQNQIEAIGYKLVDHGPRAIGLARKRSADEPTLMQLIHARIAARNKKDFAEADRIREQLAAVGIELKDKKNRETGEIVTTWEIAR